MPLYWNLSGVFLMIRLGLWVSGRYGPEGRWHFITSCQGFTFIFISCRSHCQNVKFHKSRDYFVHSFIPRTLNSMQYIVNLFNYQLMGLMNKLEKMTNIRPTAFACEMKYGSRRFIEHRSKALKPFQIIWHIREINLNLHANK